MKVNKNSWHYKWYAFTKVSRNMLGDNFTRVKYRRSLGKSWVEIHDNLHHAPTNFCQYWRAVLIYPLVAALVNLSIFTVILAGLVSNPIVVGWFIVGAVGLFAVLALIAGLAIGTEAVQTRAKEMLQNEDNFFGNIYKSYKNKVCTKVIYEDK